uniref:Uncharacterized protein n=1 Tax=Triticum urartu TaxID=4572 RepID=A0A8R7PT70_TRIUA
IELSLLSLLVKKELSCPTIRSPPGTSYTSAISSDLPPAKDDVAVPHQETNPHAIPDPHVASFLVIFLPWWWHMWLGERVDLGELVDSGNAVTEMYSENVGCPTQSCRSWSFWMLGLRRH